VLTLLAFLTTSCPPCRPFWDMLSDPAARASLEVAVTVVAPSSSTEDQERLRRLAGPGLRAHMSSQTWFAYGVLQAGTFVLVRHAAGERPWQQPGEVLGVASPATPAELSEVLKRWLAQSSG